MVTMLLSCKIDCIIGIGVFDSIGLAIANIPANFPNENEYEKTSESFLQIKDCMETRLDSTLKELIMKEINFFIQAYDATMTDFCSLPEAEVSLPLA